MYSSPVHVLCNFMFPGAGGLEFLRGPPGEKGETGSQGETGLLTIGFQIKILHSH